LVEGQSEEHRDMDLGVVSPHVLTRKALCALLAPLDGLRVAMDVDNALDNFQLIGKIRPDVILLDILSPAHDLEFISRMRSLFPEVKVLVLSDGADEEFQVRAIEAGAHGCVSKRSEPAVLENAVRLVGQGETWATRQANARPAGKSARWQVRKQRNAADLTQREWEVLALVAGGCRNKEIAARLLVSENTVKTHLYTIYRKLQVGTRLRAALRYFQQAKQQVELPVGVSPGDGAKSGGSGQAAAQAYSDLAPERNRVKS
jgi:DNA-binding NarL/FixJ family response regulator